MSWIAAFLLLQPAMFTGTVPVPNAELDAAHDCLVVSTYDWVKEYDWRPEDDERWRWALKIVGNCENEIGAAAASKEAVLWYEDISGGGVTRRQMLKSEALYYVYRLIRERFEVEE